MPEMAEALEVCSLMGVHDDQSPWSLSIPFSTRGTSSVTVPTAGRPRNGPPPRGAAAARGPAPATGCRSRGGPGRPPPARPGVDGLAAGARHGGHPRLPVARAPQQLHGGLRRSPTPHDRERQPPGRDRPRAVHLEEVLARQRPAPDRDPRPVGVGHELLAREAVVAVGAAALEVAGAVDEDPRRRGPDGTSNAPGAAASAARTTSTTRRRVAISSPPTACWSDTVAASSAIGRPAVSAPRTAALASGPSRSPGSPARSASRPRTIRWASQCSGGSQPVAGESTAYPVQIDWSSDTSRKSASPGTSGPRSRSQTTPSAPGPAASRPRGRGRRTARGRAGRCRPA